MLRLLIIVLFFAALAIFALSNPDQITIWIASIGWPVTTGLFILALAVFSLIIGFLIGWFGEIRQRRRARKAESKVRSLEKQLVELHQRLDQVKASSTSQAEENVSASSTSSRI